MKQHKKSTSEKQISSDKKEISVARLIHTQDYEHQPHRYRLWSFAVLTILLAIVLTVRSLNAQRLQDPICRGTAGAGFPLIFLCDTLGESPTGSWGKIDEADEWFPNPFFLANVMFYTMLLWMPWFTVRGLAHWIRRWRIPLG